MSAAPMMDLDHEGNDGDDRALPSSADAAFSFSLAKSYLAEALAKVVGLASAGKLPIAQSVLVEAHTDHLTLSTTNFDQWITTTLPGVTASARGVVALPAKRLQEIVNAMPAGVVTIAIKAKRAKITAGRARFEIVGLSAEEWPTAPTFTPAFSLSIDPPAFQSALERAASHLGETSVTASRPALAGVCFAADADGVIAVGSDGHSWAVVRLTRDPVLTSFSVILPEVAVSHAKRMLAGADVVTVTAGEQHAVIAAGRSILTTRLINAEYPISGLRNVDRQTVQLRALVDRVELLTAVDRVRLVYTGPGPKLVELAFTEDAIVIEADALDAGESEDRVSATREILAPGAARRIAVNADYFLICLKSLMTERVHLCVTGEKSPLFVLPPGGDAADADARATLAVMRLRPRNGTQRTDDIEDNTDA